MAGRGDRESPPVPRHLVVGHISKPHGTRGEVFVWPLTDRPAGVYSPGHQLMLGTTEGELPPDATVLEVQSTRPFKRGLLVKFQGIEGRTEAERLAQRYLLAPLESLEPLEEGELFYHQLLGLEVVTAEGEVVGRVREVFDTEPTHLLEVRAADGKTHLIPFAEQIVRKIDLAAGRLTVKPPPGLLEL